MNSIKPEKQIEIIKLARQGVERQEIAKRLNVSQPTIRRVLRDSGMFDLIRKTDQRKFTPEEQATIISLFNDGLSTNKIGKEVKAYGASIRKFLRGKGLLNGPTRAKYSHIKPIEFIDAVQSSTTLDEVCEKLDMDMAAAYSRYWNYKRRGVPLRDLMRAHGYDWSILSSYAQSLLDEEE